MKYVSLNELLTVNTKFQAFNQYGQRQVYDFVIPSPDHLETKAYCTKHNQDYMQVSYTLPSNKRYVSSCTKCESIKYHEQLMEERKKEGYPTFRSKQEMMAYFENQKQEEIKQKEETRYKSDY